MAHGHISISKEELRQLYWNKRLTSFEIADFLGCSAGTVIARMKEYGIKRRVSGPKRVRVKKDALRVLYQDKNLSTRKIARIFHCDQGVILRALKKHGISIKHPKEAKYIDGEVLHQLYSLQKLSTYKIAERYGCDPKTVNRCLKQYSIPIRRLKRINLTREELRNLYIHRRYSLRVIADLYDCQPACILRKMEGYDIPRRSISETSTKHRKKNFSGNLIERAYMIGFRLGDLGVRKKGTLINVGCGTTKPDQICLVKGLFKGYGPSWMSKKDKHGRVHVDFTLNKSFRFLTPKHKNIPKWVVRTQKPFLAFLAGYADAEGTIGVYSGRARFRIGSYDQGILEDIHKKISELGVRSHIRQESKPHIDRRGIRHNGCFWRVSVNEMESVLKILALLGPYMRHKKRLRDLSYAEKNVNARLKKKV